SSIDSIISNDTNDWVDEDDLNMGSPPTDFNTVGDYRFREVQNLVCGNEEPEVLILNSTTTTPLARDIDRLRPKFGWISKDLIKKTLDVTTQYARNLGIQGNMKQHFKTRFPALNVSRRNEPVATDTVYSDVPAVADGSMCAQFFVGKDSLVCDVYGMKTDKEFVNTLEDNIRKRGAMDKLISDRAQAEISSKVKTILRALVIDDWQSEPHHQHQNYAERRYQTVKARTNVIMNCSGAPAKTWLLCLGYVCFLMNHLATESLGWKTPMQVYTGETSDVSPLLHFQFYEEVNYMRHSSDFPSESTEEVGYFVGFGESVGDTMTFNDNYHYWLSRFLHDSTDSVWL
ncbi:MAG TPA: hypothetical protein VLS94_01660, partial [Fusibacter sp.]|nr:hypothetical protein [Fusibacter sp.]